MSKLTTYSSLYIECEETSLSFYTEFLKFTHFLSLKLDDKEEWWVLKMDNKENIGLILIKTKPKKRCRSTLILSSQDSILTYCKLKEVGVKDLSEPSYSALGLSFNFSDPSGNRIMVLEERLYNDL